MSEQKREGPVLGARERGLVTDLFLRDPPSFPIEEEASNGRRLLKKVLSDGDAFHEHLDLLSSLYRARYRRAVPRRDRPVGAAPRKPAEKQTGKSGFRFCRLPEEEEEAKVVERGVGKDVLSDDEVAELLLNPFALDDLADRIHDALPEAWLDDLVSAGRAMRERYGLPPSEELVAEALGRRPTEELMAAGWAPEGEGPQDEAELAGMLAGAERLGTNGSAKLEAAGAGTWMLAFTGDAARALARRVAEHVYGDAGRSFTLKLRALPAREGASFELEAAPAPCCNPLAVAVTFPGGERRVFTVEVPPEVGEAPPDEWRPSMASLPCEPVPMKSAELKGGAWRPESGPPGAAELVLAADR